MPILQEDCNSCQIEVVDYGNSRPEQTDLQNVIHHSSLSFHLLSIRLR